MDRAVVTRALTASTRKREVFPAFCKPIIVMSISVALCASRQWSTPPETTIGVSPVPRLDGSLVTERVRSRYVQSDSIIRGGHVPKESQQPVIDGLEEACHYCGKRDGRESSLSLLMFRDTLRPVFVARFFGRG